MVAEQCPNLLKSVSGQGIAAHWLSGSDKKGFYLETGKW